MRNTQTIQVSAMQLAIAGILGFFLPGIIGYGGICWLMPAHGLLARLFRAFLIVIVTTVLGAVGGYIFVYIRDPGPYTDGWHLNMAFTFGMLQLAIGMVLGLLSLSSFSAAMKHDSEVVKLAKQSKQNDSTPPASTV